MLLLQSSIISFLQLISLILNNLATCHMSHCDDSCASTAVEYVARKAQLLENERQDLEGKAG